MGNHFKNFFIQRLNNKVRFLCLTIVFAKKGPYQDRGFSFSAYARTKLIDQQEKYGS
jgi:hypothetical protein